MALTRGSKRAGRALAPLAFVALALGALPDAALAQTVSDIVRDGSVGDPDPTLQPDVAPLPDGGQAITIGERLGERPGAGPNLFHSFFRFDLAAGDRAIFDADPALATERIISRITGGDVSLIFGTIASAVPGADLYLLNPAGIVFGPGAQLDVAGSFIATTANSVDFAGGERFSADRASGAPLLQMPAIAAFGFLDRPAPIQSVGAALSVPTDASLLLAGGDVLVAQSMFGAPSGQVDLAAVGSAGRVTIDDRGDAPRLLDASADVLGSVTLSGARLTLDDRRRARAGDVRILGGALRFDGAVVSASGFDGGSGGRIELFGDTVDLDRGTLLLAQGFRGSDAGEVFVDAERVSLRGSTLFAESDRGESGRIDVRARSFSAVGTGDRDLLLSARGFGGADGGRIRIDAGSHVLDRATISATAFAGDGDGGRVELLGGDVLLVDGDIGARSPGGGRGGTISFDVSGAVRFERGSEVTVAVDMGGAGGEVRIASDRLELDGSDGRTFVIASSGHVSVDARQVSLLASTIAAEGIAGAAPGTVDVRTGRFVAEGIRREGGLERSFVIARGFGGSDGGQVRLFADDAAIVESTLSTTAFATRAEGGGILRLGGNGGEVRVSGGDLRVVGGDVAARSEDGGRGGAIDVAVTGDVSLERGSELTVLASPGTPAGSIRIASERLALDGGSILRAQTIGAGAAPGGIEVRASDVRLQGGSSFFADGFDGGQGGGIDIESDVLRLTASSLLSQGFSGGSGGQVSLRSGSVRLEDGAQVGVEGISGASAGAIDIASDELVLDGAVRIAAQSVGGLAGRISIAGRSVVARNGAIVAVDGFAGSSGGTLEITSGSLLLEAAAGLFAQGVTGGSAGRIAVSADEVRIDSGARISAETFSADPEIVGGAGGDVDISAGSLLLDGGGAIRVRGNAGGRAGNVSVRADSIRLDHDALISAESFGGPPMVPGATAGNVDITAGSLLLDNGGDISVAGSDGGRGGNVSVRADTILIRAPEDFAAGDGSGIDAVSRGGSSAGSIRIEAGALELVGRAAIFAVGFAGSPGGEIAIDAGTVAVRRGAQLNSGAVAGRAGSITIGARERVEISNAGGGPFDIVQALASVQGNDDVSFSGVFATSGGGSGQGGTVAITAPDVVLDEGGFIASITLGATDAGNVELSGERIEIRDGSGIDTGTAGTGTGGDLRLVASERIRIAGNNEQDRNFPSRIRSITVGPSAAGDIVLSAPTIEIDGGALASSTVQSVLTPLSGAAGDVRIDADSLRIVRGGTIDSSSLSGSRGGRIEISARDRVEISGPTSTIAARAAADGAGGAIELSTENLALSEGGSIVTDSAGGPGSPDPLVFLRDLAAAGLFRIPTGDPSGVAGSIGLQVGRATLEGASRISTAARLGAQAGAPVEASVAIEARTSVELSGGSEITASVVDGRGGDITVSTPGVVVLRDASRVVAEARGDGGSTFRQGGRIDIAAGLLLRESDAVVSADAGQGIAGTVSLNAPEVELDPERVALPADFLDAATLFKPRCAAASQRGDASSFVIAARQGVAPSPEGLLVAFDLDPSPAPLPGSGPEDPAAVASPPPVAAAPDELAAVIEADVDAKLAFRGGRFDAALEKWSEAKEGYAGLGDDGGEADSLRNRAQAQQALGDYADSLAGLAEAVEMAEAARDDVRLARALGALGNAFVGLEQPELAERYLRRGLARARAAGVAPLAATLLNNLGNATAARGDYSAALALYRRSADEASGLAALRAYSNASRAALATDDLDTARAFAAAAYAALRDTEVDPTREGVDLRIHLGVTYRALLAATPASDDALLARAGELLRAASSGAESVGDGRAAAFALGNLAGLYERENRFDEARVLTRRALAQAERVGALDSVYRWHWQLGRLLWAEGRANDALEAYRRAAHILRETRPELRYHYGSRESVFGSAVGPVYRDLVNALLASSSLVASEAHVQALLLEARDRVEELKAAELRDYFRDECLADLEARATPLDSVSPRAAVVYPIVLPDRLEILVTLRGGVRRHTVPVSAETLRAETLRFREMLGEYTTSRYLEPSWQLYDWLVRPYVADLERSGIDTIVFVPGGPLRTIPLAALHDRNGFLIERFGVAVTPSLALTDPRELDLSGRKMLLAGISEAAHGFDALPNVPDELRSIEELYGGTVLLDESFTSDAFGARLNDAEISAVHLASHAKFTGRVASSFLLAYDGPVSMEQLSDYVGATRFRDRSLELLVMSACETAAGDERAALGLAGVAIKAGARSAVGSLWQINDRTATELMTRFYHELGTPGVSKAAALQRAQRELIALGAHPYLWSPFLVISNWL